MTLSVKTQKILCKFFRNIADLELNVEEYRQKLAEQYDFEPYAAFCRIDADGDGTVYVKDFYNFLKQNEVHHLCLKDCQLMMQFYDLDGSGSLSYNEFLKFILPCDDAQLREDACQRKTYKVDIKNGKRLYPAVEKTMTDYFEREMNIHIKIEMLKRAVDMCPDWNTKAAFNLIDSQRQGYISHPQIYSFLSANGHDASDKELVAIVRRIDSSGNGAVDYGEFCTLTDPIILKNLDLQEIEDQGDYIRKNHRPVDESNTQPFLKKGPAQVVQPMSMNNTLDLNLQLYDNVQTMQSPSRAGGNQSTYENPENGASPFTAGKSMGGRSMGGMQRDANSPLRKSTLQQSVYPQGGMGAEYGEYPRGPPMTDMTNIHGGSFHQGSALQKHGYLSAEDEKNMTQVLFEMIMQETRLEKHKQDLVEQSDFNLMDGFQMMDEKNLGWVSAPQILTFLIKMGIFAHKDDVYTFVRRFDRDHDSKLLYSDYCDFMTPKDSYYKHALTGRQPKYIHCKDVPRKNYFTDQTRDLFFQLFKLYFSTDEHLELCKKQLTRKPSFNVHDAFSQVDTYRKGSLTIDDLKRFMQKNGFHPTETELAHLNFRFDRNLNGIISYSEFMTEIVPTKSLLGDVASMNLLRKKD